MRVFSTLMPRSNENKRVACELMKVDWILPGHERDGATSRI